MEIEDETYDISKHNRRESKEAEQEREVHHSFKLVEHPLSKKFLQKRKHQLERRALKRKK